MNYPIKYDPKHYNPDAKKLQQLLQKYGKNVKADGLFGPATRTALYQVEDSLGMSRDANVDEFIWEELEGNAPATFSPIIGPKPSLVPATKNSSMLSKLNPMLWDRKQQIIVGAGLVVMLGSLYYFNRVRA